MVLALELKHVFHRAVRYFLQNHLADYNALARPQAELAVGGGVGTRSVHEVSYSNVYNVKVQQLHDWPSCEDVLVNNFSITGVEVEGSSLNTAFVLLMTDGF